MAQESANEWQIYGKDFAFVYKLFLKQCNFDKKIKILFYGHFMEIIFINSNLPFFILSYQLLFCYLDALQNIQILFQNILRHSISFNYTFF